MISISTAHNLARLTATQAFVDSGGGTPKFQLFDGTRPANGSGGASPMAEIPLTKGGSVFVDGKLRLTSNTPGLVMTTGTPTWARLLNAAGDHVLDCDASGPGGTTELIVSSSPLYAGGAVTITTAEFG